MEEALKPKHTVRLDAYSVTPHGTHIATFVLRYWRAIHAELMTHRVFSRNASSSRAIPVKTVLKQVWNDPAGPMYWGSNKPGMQAGKELDGWKQKLAQWLWATAGKVACIFAWGMMKVGLHKQVANRILEPWQYINVVLTATDFDNFFHLRCHPDAMPELRALAEDMRAALEYTPLRKLRHGDWHLPLTTVEERVVEDIDTLLHMSTARCARVSYNKHDGGQSSFKEDCDLHDKLVGGSPIHASPTEHQVMYSQKLPRSIRVDLKGNLRGPGIVQYRKLIETPQLRDYYLNETRAVNRLSTEKSL